MENPHKIGITPIETVLIVQKFNLATWKTQLTHKISFSSPQMYTKSLNSLSVPSNHRRYKILCINLVKDVPKPEVASQIILSHIQLPEENYRMGKTKVQLFSTDGQIKNNLYI